MFTRYLDFQMHYQKAIRPDPADSINGIIAYQDNSSVKKKKEKERVKLMA